MTTALLRAEVTLIATDNTRTVYEVPTEGILNSDEDKYTLRVSTKELPDPATTDFEGWEVVIGHQGDGTITFAGSITDFRLIELPIINNRKTIEFTCESGEYIQRDEISYSLRESQ